MGIVFRQSIKATLVIFTGVLLGASFTYCSTLAVPISELGGTRIILAQGAVLQLFFLMGTGSLIQVFSQRYLDKDPRRPVLVTLSLFIPIAVALLSSVPYFFLRDFIISRYQSTDRDFLTRYYWWIMVVSILLSYMTLLEHYLAAQYKVAASIFMREVVLRICLLGLLATFYFGWISFSQYVIGLVVAHIIPLGFLIALSARTTGFYISTRWSVFSKSDYREMIHYAWYHMLTGVSLNVLSFVDVLLLGPLSPSGLADVAIYTNAQFFIAIMIVPYRAMAVAAFPKLNEAWLKNNHSEIHTLFHRAGLNMFIVAVGMWLLVCTNLHNAVAVFPERYAALLPVALILSLGRMVDMSTGLNTELISITQYYRFNFRMSLILLIVVIIADRIFIPKGGIYGAAWVASGALVLFNIVKMIFLYAKTGLQPFSRGSIGTFVSGLIGLTAHLLLPYLANPFVDTFLRSVVVMACFAISLLLLRPSPDLTAYLSQIRKSRRLF